MRHDETIYVAGHKGLIGSAIVRKLANQGYANVLCMDRSDLDLTDQMAVKEFFRVHRPAYVFLAAGKVGGVYANNTYRADFIYENTIIQANVIHQAFLNEVKKLIFFGCSCMYPRLCSEPIKEEQLLTGPLEPTNQPFAVAKIAGVEMCESYNRQYGTDFVSLIPTNVYGINQNYERMNSLVIPALIRRFHEAKVRNEREVVIWGSGRPARDFLFSDDLADASLFLMQRTMTPGVFNIGTGKDYTIRECAEMIKRVSGYDGSILYDTGKPEGVLTKLQDISKIRALGWSYQTSLEIGLATVYRHFSDHYEEIVGQDH